MNPKKITYLPWRVNSMRTVHLKNKGERAIKNVPVLYADPAVFLNVDPDPALKTL